MINSSLNTKLVTYVLAWRGFWTYSYFYAPLQRREGILLCTCRSVGRSVGPFVTFSFPINYSRTPWPTFLKHPHKCPHIRIRQQRNPIDCGPLGQRSRAPGWNVQKLQFRKWISSSYMYATYFELANPVVQNICDKKTPSLVKDLFFS